VARHQPGSAPRGALGGLGAGAPQPYGGGGSGSQVTHNGGNTFIQNFYGSQPTIEQRRAIMLELSAAVGVS
jgi:hypothetical protein